MEELSLVLRQILTKLETVSDEDKSLLLIFRKRLIQEKQKFYADNKYEINNFLLLQCSKYLSKG